MIKTGLRAEASWPARDSIMTTRGTSILCLSFIAVAPAFLTGCAYPMRVDSDYGTAFKLSNLGPTFSWRPGFETSWADPAVPYHETRLFVRDSIIQDLEARGFTLAEPNKADFWIDYRFSSENRSDPYEHFIKYEWSKLVFHVLEPNTGQGIWRAWAESRVPESFAPSQHRQEIRNAVSELVRRFPYRPCPNSKYAVVAKPETPDPAPPPSAQ